jgi:hypothetical protein
LSSGCCKGFQVIEGRIHSGCSDYDLHRNATFITVQCIDEEARVLQFVGRRLEEEITDLREAAFSCLVRKIRVSVVLH